MKTRRNAPFISGMVALILFFGIGTGCKKFHREILLSDTVPEIDKTREAKVVTAFFGLDNGLTQKARALYRKAPGKDGMPLVFSLEIDPATLDASDFKVTSKNGTVYTVEAATLLPANEEFELRTVLLIGEYGDYPDNPPVSVNISGDLMSRTGQNFKGQTIAVIPLEEGPILSYAEYFTLTDDYPYVASGYGCDCPKEETQLVVKAVWSGGVRALNGDELGQNEVDDFIITLVKDEDTVTVSPFQLADIDDNDNNIDLCLDESGIPILLQVNEKVAIDPRGDKNPETKVAIKSRW
jgi:hypothetical protein